MKPRILAYSKSKILLADVKSDSQEVTEETNFKGVLSILDPISSTESDYLFSMRLGSFTIDVAFSYDIYLFSVIPIKIKSSIAAFNPIFSYLTLTVFNKIILDVPNREAIPQGYIDTFYSMIPVDPLNKISKIMNSLLIDSVDYIAFIAQGHRVVLSLGDAKMPPDEFIVQWCEALEVVETLTVDNAFLTVPSHNNIIVSHFFPSLTSVTFFNSPATKDRIENYFHQIDHVKSQLFDLFKSSDLKPQMPQVPKQQSSGRRRIQVNKS